MKNLYALIITLTAPLFLAGQTSHDIEVFSFGFNPSELTIQVGDTVIWTNTGGSHNVNGTLASFPDNPEGFGNSVSAELWTYSHVFTIEGVYNYQCNPHAGLMQGTITVEGDVTNTSEQSENDIIVFPSPAVDNVRIEGLPSDQQVVFDVFDITGKRALQLNASSGELLDVSDLNSGLYIYVIRLTDGDQITGKLLID